MRLTSQLAQRLEIAGCLRRAEEDPPPYIYQGPSFGSWGPCGARIFRRRAGCDHRRCKRSACQPLMPARAVGLRPGVRQHHGSSCRAWSCPWPTRSRGGPSLPGCADAPSPGRQPAASRLLRLCLGNCATRQRRLFAVHLAVGLRGPVCDRRSPSTGPRWCGLLERMEHSTTASGLDRSAAICHPASEGDCWPPQLESSDQEAGFFSFRWSKEPRQ
jgi:hypothetical protein